MDFALTKATPQTVSLRYIDGADTGITVTLRHKSDPTIKDFEKKAAKEHISFGDSNPSQEDFTALLERQTSERRFITIESWEWPDGATFKGKDPELTLEFVTMVCGELDWFRAEIDRHIKNEAAFHPKWESVSAKP